MRKTALCQFQIPNKKLLQIQVCKYIVTYWSDDFDQIGHSIMSYKKIPLKKTYEKESLKEMENFYSKESKEQIWLLFQGRYTEAK